MKRNNLIFYLAITFLMTSLIVLSGCAKKKVVKIEETAVEGEEKTAIEGVEGVEGSGPELGKTVREAIEEIIELPPQTGIEEEEIEKRISRLGEESIEGIEGREIVRTDINEIIGEEEGLLTIFFDFDMYNIRGDSRETLKKNARWLREHPTVRIKIEGHADERGSNEYNMALGERRARSVKDYLKNLGLEKQFKTVSYGEEMPVCEEAYEGCWSRNRRAEFIVISE